MEKTFNRRDAMNAEKANPAKPPASIAVVTICFLVRREDFWKAAPLRGVAQICNLLYRRIAFGRVSKAPIRRVCLRPADCKSAIQQNAILRYGVFDACYELMRDCIRHYLDTTNELGQRNS